MSYTNGTTHYNLPLTTSNDKRDWADTNQAFTDVDAALYGAVSNTSTQGEEITALDTRLTTAEGNISTNAGNIAALDSRLTTAEGNITTQANQIADVRSDAEDIICAYNEATATSTHAYNIGAYFIYNDVLYRATADIEVGDTIVPDTNCTTTNVTTEIATAGNNAIDMICTVVENTTTATRNYSVGDYFILNDTLYRVTATITVGTTIIPETNCTSTNVTTELMTAGSDAVDMICTVTENTSTATRNYAAGDYFILNDVLYKVTVSINIGGSIIPGTNCESTTACTELNTLNVHSVAPSSFNVVDLSSYTTASGNKYKCPSDGYVQMLGTADTSGLLRVFATNGTSVTYTLVKELSCLVFVKKGMLVNGEDFSTFQFVGFEY